MDLFLTKWSGDPGEFEVILGQQANFRRDHLPERRMALNSCGQESCRTSISTGSPVDDHHLPMGRQGGCARGFGARLYFLSSMLSVRATRIVSLQILTKSRAWVTRLIVSYVKGLISFLVVPVET
jgi:hypothetical protein